MYYVSEEGLIQVRKCRYVSPELVSPVYTLEVSGILSMYQDISVEILDI